MMKLNIPTIPFATAFGMPLNDAIDRLAATASELTAAAERTSRGQGGFGSRLSAAVKRKQSSYAVFAEALRKNNDDDEDDDKDGGKDTDNDSFGKRIKKAIERKSRASKTQKQHQEFAERERQRYQQPQPRKRTKGE
jgi:hypothetical protein